MFVVAVDVETSGPCPKSNFLIEIGLCCVDTSKYNPEQPTECVVSEFSSYVRKPVDREWQPQCVEQFWSKNPELFDRARLTIKSPETPTQDEVGESCVAWIASLPPGTKILVTDMAAFDFIWLQHLLPPGVTLLYLFGKYEMDPVDVTSFYSGLMRKPLGSTHSVSALTTDMFNRIPKGSAHRAVDDARYIALGAAHSIQNWELSAPA